MRIFILATLALCLVAPFSAGQVTLDNDGGLDLPKAYEPGFAIDQVVIAPYVDNDPIGDLPTLLGWTEQEDGGFQVLVDAPDGSIVTQWMLGDDGVPIMPLQTATVRSKVASFGDTDGIGVLPLTALDNDDDWGLPFHLHASTPLGGGVIMSGVYILSNDPIGGLPVTAPTGGGDGTSVNGGSAAGGSATGNGGGQPGFTTGTCHKPKCRLTLHWKDGTKTSLPLENNEVYHVPWSADLLIATCVCN